MSQMTCEDCGKKYYQPDGISDTRCSSCHAIYYATHDNPGIGGTKYTIWTRYGTLYEIDKDGCFLRYGDNKWKHPHNEWKFLGFAELLPFGHTRRISFEDSIRMMESKTQWLRKNGKPKYTVIDLDHGTQRIWGNAGVHGVERAFRSMSENPPSKWKGKRKGVMPSSMHFHGPKGHEHRHKGKYRHNPKVDVVGQKRSNAIENAFDRLVGAMKSSPFMEPQLDYGTYVLVENGGDGPGVDAWIPIEYKDKDMTILEKRTGYWFHLSAPGYMDQTEWTPINSVSELESEFEDNVVEDEYEENPRAKTYKPIGPNCSNCGRFAGSCYGECKRILRPYEEIFCQPRGKGWQAKHYCIQCARKEGLVD